MIRRPSRHELMADFLYIVVAMLASFLIIFIFDIHWSLYPGESLLPPSRRVFAGNPTPYYIGIPLGGIIGFFLLKVIAHAFIEEEEAREEAVQKDRPGAGNERPYRKSARGHRAGSAGGKPVSADRWP